jgi:predicted anti-sigma-YlaC factor YlaD
MTDVTCRDLLDGLSDYLEGEAHSELCAEIARHLAGCSKCRIVVDTLRKTVTLYHQLPQPPMPAQVRERLYKRLDLADYLPPRSDAT